MAVIVPPAASSAISKEPGPNGVGSPAFPPDTSLIARMDST